MLIKWNPGSFVLTDADAAATEKITSPGGTATIRWGVINPSGGTPYSGENIFNHTPSDYTWFTDFSAAKQAGTVSAISFDRPAVITGTTIKNIGAELIIHAGDRIGGTDSAGNPNLFVGSLFVYPDANRNTAVPVTETGYPKFTTPDIYDNNTVVKLTASNNKQLLTIGVVHNAFSTYKGIDDGGNTYSESFSTFAYTGLFRSPRQRPWTDGVFAKAVDYNPNKAQTIHVPGGMVYLDMTHPDQKQKITRSITLPEGVRFDPGIPPTLDTQNSFATPAANEAAWADFPLKMPLIYNNNDGSTTLVWTYELSYNDLQKRFVFGGASNTIPDIQFNVRFDDYNWKYTGVSPTYNVRLPQPGQKISVADDVTNNAAYSTDANLTQSLTVDLNAGPYVSTLVPQAAGYPDSTFVVKNRPYSSVDPTGNDDEMGVIPVPRNNDAQGSKFHGSITLTGLSVTGGTHTVDVYLSHAAAAPDIADPRKVDVNDGTWTLFDGDTSKLAGVTAIYYHVHGNMPPFEQTVSIDTTYTTKDNMPGDLYVVNSTINGLTTGPNTPTPVINHSAPSTYQIVGGVFSGLVWRDMNNVVNGTTQGPDGLFNHQDMAIDGTTVPVGVNLFKKDADNQWVLVRHYDPATRQITMNDVVQDASGNYSLDALSAGDYRAGFNMGDAEASGLSPTWPNVALDGESSINSDIDKKDTVKVGNETYYLTSQTHTLPDLTNYTYTTDLNYTHVDAGFTGDDNGKYSLTVPTLNFGTHVIPAIATVLPNLPASGQTTPNNRITATLTPVYANPYMMDLSVGMSAFHLLDNHGAPTSTVGLQGSSIDYFAQASDTTPVASIQPGGTAQLLWHNVRVAGSQQVDYNRITLDVPPASAANAVQTGQYQATVTYTLNVGGL